VTERDHRGSHFKRAVEVDDPVENPEGHPTGEYPEYREGAEYPDDADYDEDGDYQDDGDYHDDAGGRGRGDDDSWRRVEQFSVRHRVPRWLTILAIIIVLGLIAGALGVVWVHRQIDPGGKPGASVSVAIPAGSSTSKIASVLGKAGVIHSPSVFKLYVKIKSAGPLLAGTYSLPKNSRYDTVISTLSKGPPPPTVVRRFTIPEGFTLEQIAARVGTLPGLSAAKFLALATGGTVRSTFEPAGVNTLEGLLYPATYDVKDGEDETSILQRMVSAFDNTATSLGITAAAARLGITPYQVVVVASIVEREAKLDEDRGPIASVIYNRLAKGTLLQIDSTVMYGQHITDPHQINTKTASPYNTYLNKGLPPTPIASPGTPSLQAAANPPKTTYLYYVLIDPNGKQAFASTDKEFAVLKAQAKAKGLL
jgi:UPF0755 protein